MMALLGLVLGLLIGAAVYHFFFRLSPAERQHEMQLKEANLKLKMYHAEVTHYLNESATMMNQLQGICDRFHDHILDGAVKLNLASNKQSALQPAPYGDQTLAAAPTTPPKDYV